MSSPEAVLDHRSARAVEASNNARKLSFDDLLIDLDAYRVSRAGRLIELGPIEYRLLCFFLRNPTRVFTREELIEAVWSTDRTIDVRTVDVQIGRLRRLLTRRGQVDPIRTVRTVGYALG